MQNYFQLLDDGDKEVLNSSLKFYYLTEEKESTGYDLYQGGGYLGITPNSWHSDMGVFHMFRHLLQADPKTKLRLYSMAQYIGLEMHARTDTGFNFLTIGGFSQQVVKNADAIKWITSYGSRHWEIIVSSLQF